MRPHQLLIALTALLVAALPACSEKTAPTKSPKANGNTDPGAALDDVGETVTTESGLRITTLAEGSGPSPKASDQVEVHYHGTFEDGTVFDSSVDRGQTASFPLRRVIKCWTEGLQRMKVGGKARLVCPPQIAYGSGGNARIPANSTLYFDVELIAIK